MKRRSGDRHLYHSPNQGEQYGDDQCDRDRPTAGLNTFQLVADPDNAISETDEQNNAAVLTVTADNTRTTDLSVYPAGMTFILHPNAVPGDLFSIQSVVKNDGSSSVVTDVAFYNGDPRSGGVMMGRKTLTIPPFSTETAWEDLPLPSGSPVIYAWADPTMWLLSRTK